MCRVLINNQISFISERLHKGTKTVEDVTRTTSKNNLLKRIKLIYIFKQFFSKSDTLNKKM